MSSAIWLHFRRNITVTFRNRKCDVRMTMRMVCWKRKKSKRISKIMMTHITATNKHCNRSLQTVQKNQAIYHSVRYTFLPKKFWIFLAAIQNRSGISKVMLCVSSARSTDSNRKLANHWKQSIIQSLCITGNTIRKIERWYMRGLLDHEGGRWRRLKMVTVHGMLAEASRSQVSSMQNTFKNAFSVQRNRKLGRVDSYQFQFVWLINRWDFQVIRQWGAEW